jgi:hypothetical protein
MDDFDERLRAFNSGEANLSPEERIELTRDAIAELDRLVAEAKRLTGEKDPARTKHLIEQGELRALHLRLMIGPENIRQ